METQKTRLRTLPFHYRRYLSGNREDIWCHGTFQSMLSLLALAPTCTCEVQWHQRSAGSSTKQEYGPDNYVPPVFITYWSLPGHGSAPDSIMVGVAIAYALYMVAK